MGELQCRPAHQIAPQCAVTAWNRAATGHKWRPRSRLPRDGDMDHPDTPPLLKRPASNKFNTRNLNILHYLRFFKARSTAQFNDGRNDLLSAASGVAENRPASLSRERREGHSNKSRSWPMAGAWRRPKGLAQPYDCTEHRRNPLAAASITVTTRFFRTKFTELSTCLAGFDLNAGSAGGVLDHKAASGPEIERRRIQNQSVTDSQGGEALLHLHKARFLRPVTTGQSRPSGKQHRLGQPWPIRRREAADEELQSFKAPLTSLADDTDHLVGVLDFQHFGRIVAAVCTVFAKFVAALLPIRPSPSPFRQHSDPTLKGLPFGGRELGVVKNLLLRAHIPGRGHQASQSGRCPGLDRGAGRSGLETP
ncbi:hypothetical protein ACVWXP_003825 [Bradyrhizobium sp. USDA 4463]